MPDRPSLHIAAVGIGLAILGLVFGLVVLVGTIVTTYGLEMMAALCLTALGATILAYPIGRGFLALCGVTA